MSSPVNFSQGRLTPEAIQQAEDRLRSPIRTPEEVVAMRAAEQFAETVRQRPQSAPSTVPDLEARLRSPIRTHAEEVAMRAAEQFAETVRQRPQSAPSSVSAPAPGSAPGSASGSWTSPPPHRIHTGVPSQQSQETSNKSLPGSVSGVSEPETSSSGDSVGTLPRTEAQRDMSCNESMHRTKAHIDLKDARELRRNNAQSSMFV